MKQLDEVEKAKAEQKDKPTKKHPPRASMTDPEARFMRMPDGGNRPAYNVQLAVGTQNRAIVGVEVTNAGRDAGLSEPIREQVEQRSGSEVKEQLIDGGFAKLGAIDQATADNTTIYMPVPKPRKAGTGPHQPKRTDSEPVKERRQRMATEQAKEI